ncbi:MAG: hypothetical protein AAFX94_14370 [Myxococcota bacterium]
MAGNGFSSFSEFRNAMKIGGSGLQSQVEDMADEIYQVEVEQEFDNLWDAFDRNDDD